MIVHCPNGAVVVVNECPWTDGAYLAVNSSGGGTGVIVGPATLDQVRAELDRIAAAIADRAEANPQKRNAA